MKSKNILINGSVQSGKTKLIIDISIKIYKLGYDIIIFVNNFNMDLKQLETRFSNYLVENNCSKDVVFRSARHRSLRRRRSPSGRS